MVKNGNVNNFCLNDATDFILGHRQVWRKSDKITSRDVT